MKKYGQVKFKMTKFLQVMKQNDYITSWNKMTTFLLELNKTVCSFTKIEYFFLPEGLCDLL